MDTKYPELEKISVDRRSGTPIYLQIRSTIEEGILNGRLPLASRLPAVRELALQLNVNQMTVAKAYKTLAADGLIAARGAGGTFVAKRPPALDTDLRSRAARATPLSDRISALARAPGVISFIHAYPKFDEILAGIYARGLARLAKQPRADLFGYSSPAGSKRMRTACADFVKRYGIATAAPDVIVTSGGQQAIDVVARSLLRPGDTVVVERPTYYAALDVFRSCGARIVSVGLEKDGLDLEELARVVRDHRPKLLYTVPTFHNPTGITTSLKKRQAIIEMAAASRFEIMEDDYCPEMRFRGEAVPPLRSLAGQEVPVFYVRGFGKFYVPGTRLGMIVCPPGRSGEVLLTKGLTDLHTSTLLQEAFIDFLADIKPKELVTSLTSQFNLVQRRLFDALSRLLPSEVAIGLPDGGLNLWIVLPRRISSEEIYSAAVQHSVAFMAGDGFYPDSDAPSAIRISFGLVEEHQIEEGAARISAAVSDLLEGAVSDMNYVV